MEQGAHDVLVHGSEAIDIIRPSDYDRNRDGNGDGSRP